LTAREREVVQLIAEGKQQQEDRAPAQHQRQDGGDSPLGLDAQARHPLTPSWSATRSGQRLVVP